MKSDKKASEKLENVHIGVDVSKARLDIYVPSVKEGTDPLNTDVVNGVEGFRKLRDMARKAKAVVCVEPTGGYEFGLVTYMLQHDVPVAYADALRVRHFAKAEGNQSKNDTLDAELISRFADKMGVRLISLPDADMIELKRKNMLRGRLIAMKTALVSQLETEPDKGVARLIERHIKNLQELIDEIRKSCLEIIGRKEDSNALYQRFIGIGGVSDGTAISVIAGLPEIGTLPDAKLFRLAGIAPEQKQSGTKERARRIWGGRKDVRNALYMSVTSAIQWNSILGEYYRKKRAEGHPHKWAAVPTMRKLLSLMNRIARDPNFVPREEPESTKKNARAGRKRKSA